MNLPLNLDKCLSHAVSFGKELHRGLKNSSVSFMFFLSPAEFISCPRFLSSDFWFPLQDARVSEAMVLVYLQGFKLGHWDPKSTHNKTNQETAFSWTAESQGLGTSKPFWDVIARDWNKNGNFPRGKVNHRNRTNPPPSLSRKAVLPAPPCFNSQLLTVLFAAGP